MDAENSIPPPTSVPTSRADYIGERLAAIKAYSNERAEKDRALIEELMKALEPFADLADQAEQQWSKLPARMRPSVKPADSDYVSITLGACRKVRSLLSRAKEAGYG